MIAGIHYVWCLFVSWLMRRTFNVTAAEVVELRRESAALAKERTESVTHWIEAEAERDHFRVLATRREERANALHATVKVYRAALESVASSRTHTAATVEARRALRHEPPTVPSMLAARPVDPS